ncbi:hypothetical protein [Streptomyces canus]|uniref:hypothetical protein n=1 Tax=Streptomyces canus TaxID=58343 RepID=UPI00036B8200|nr:hypothetical protein [Streptomyces canus]
MSSFDTERNLGSYYTRQGVSVLGPRQAIDVGSLLTGGPLYLGAGPGLTFFHRWRQQER